MPTARFCEGKSLKPPFCVFFLKKTAFSCVRRLSHRFRFSSFLQGCLCHHRRSASLFFRALETSVALCQTENCIKPLFGQLNNKSLHRIMKQTISTSKHSELAEKKKLTQTRFRTCTFESSISVYHPILQLIPGKKDIVGQSHT